MIPYLTTAAKLCLNRACSPEPGGSLLTFDPFSGAASTTGALRESSAVGSRWELDRQPRGTGVKVPPERALLIQPTDSERLSKLIRRSSCGCGAAAPVCAQTHGTLSVFSFCPDFVKSAASTRRHSSKTAQSCLAFPHKSCSPST